MPALALNLGGVNQRRSSQIVWTLLRLLEKSFSSIARERPMK
jgi:hypothetical protein